MGIFALYYLDTYIHQKSVTILRLIYLFYMKKKLRADFPVILWLSSWSLHVFLMHLSLKKTGEVAKLMASLVRFLLDILPLKNNANTFSHQHLDISKPIILVLLNFDCLTDLGIRFISLCLSRSVFVPVLSILKV